MNGLDDDKMAPQTFLYGCVLESGKEVTFNPDDDDDFEHQLDLRMACVDPSAKDELHMVEVEGQDTEGQQIKAVLVSLKPSTLPSVCLGGFTITPPAVFRLKAGSGPIHISGQHLVMMEADASFDEDDDDDDEEEEEEEEDVKTSKKRPAPTQAAKSKKRMKMEMEDEESDEDDEDDAESEESPVKAKPAAPRAAAQNGKAKKATNPAKNQAKTTKEKGKKTPKTPPSPKAPLTPAEIKARLMEMVKKGTALPKVQPKFENLLKHDLRVSDAKVIADMWKWRQTLNTSK